MAQVRHTLVLAEFGVLKMTLKIFLKNGFNYLEGVELGLDP